MARLRQAKARAPLTLEIRWGRPVACGDLAGRLRENLESTATLLNVIVKRRRLPHVAVIGQPLFVIFVTFRLRDSLPASRRFPASDLTTGQAFLAMDRLLDQARCGPTFLRKHAVAELVLASLHYGSQIKHYELHSWVIMPNHLHLLLTPWVSVSKLLGSLKATSAKHANLLLQRTGQPFWQDEIYAGQNAWGYSLYSREGGHPASDEAVGEQTIWN